MFTPQPVKGFLDIKNRIHPSEEEARQSSLQTEILALFPNKNRGGYYSLYLSRYSAMEIAGKIREIVPIVLKYSPNGIPEINSSSWTG